MAWSYRKRIKIIPGVHLNLSKSGISTSIGVKGAGVTFGKSGTYLNTSIPGLGLYNRKKLSNRKESTPSLNNYYQPNYSEDNIFSADIQEITSQDMQGIKEAILAAQNQRTELQQDLARIKSTLLTSKFKLGASYLFIYGLIKKTISEKIKTDIKAQKSAIVQIREQIDNCYVGLDVKFDEEIMECYSATVQAFKKLTISHKIWDVTSAHEQNRVVARSAASTLVRKSEVRFGVKSLPDIRSKLEPMWFKNANGADLYFYPNFVIMYSSNQQFAIIGFDELDFSFSSVRFVEDGTIPPDSKIIDYTWLKVNKNGTPDKRFKDNRQIPILRYGVISLKTRTGLHEEYQISNYEIAQEFNDVFTKYN